jgi:hypothetical protein
MMTEATSTSRMAQLSEPSTEAAVVDMGHVIRKRLPDGGEFVMTVRNGRSHVWIFPPCVPSPRV